MAEEHAVGGAHGQGRFGQHPHVVVVNFAGMGPIGRANSLAEVLVEVAISLGDRAVGHLRQLVVAQQKMDLAGMLNFESGHQVEELVRLVPALRGRRNRRG